MHEWTLIPRQRDHPISAATAVRQAAIEAIQGRLCPDLEPNMLWIMVMLATTPAC
jgi:hypothetical protein